MILTELQRLRDRVQDKIIPPAHKRQKVRWFLEVSPEGKYLGLVETGSSRSDWTEVVAPLHQEDLEADALLARGQARLCSGSSER